MIPLCQTLAPHAHGSLSARAQSLQQVPQCPWFVLKRFGVHHCFLGRPTPAEWIVGKGKGLDTCQTRDQQHFAISEVAPDWHEPMVPQHIMWPSTARVNGQLDPRCS